MSVDLHQLEVGDTLVLRNNKQAVVKHVEYSTLHLTYPWNIEYVLDSIGYRSDFTESGRWWSDDAEFHRDIIAIQKAEIKE